MDRQLALGDHLRAVGGEGQDSVRAEAERQAWSHVVEGFERALSVSGLSADARGKFARRLRLCREIARLPLRDLRPAPPQRQAIG